MNNKQLFILSLIIIGTISTVLLIIFLGAILKDREITDKGRELVTGVIMALIAIVGVIVGVRESNKNN